MKIPKVPSEIEEVLDAGEEILYGTQQSRSRPTLNIKAAIGKAIAPDSLWITNKRIIIFEPSAWTLGVTKNIQDYPYTEMVNVYQHKGIMSSHVTVKMRFQPNEYNFYKPHQNESQFLPQYPDFARLFPGCQVSPDIGCLTQGPVDHIFVLGYEPENIKIGLVSRPF